MTHKIAVNILLTRGLTAPAQDHAQLEQYWAKMLHLRSVVDEELLADHETAVTYTAVDEPR